MKGETHAPPIDLPARVAVRQRVQWHRGGRPGLGTTRPANRPGSPRSKPFPSAVLSHRYPGVPNLGDMTLIAGQVRAGTVPAPDILVGDPLPILQRCRCPARPVRPAWRADLAYVEFANAIDQTRQQDHRPPAALVWENVPGVLSDRSNAFGHFLGALAGEGRALEPPETRWTHAGCVSGPRRRIAWRVLDAQYFGVAQRRRRVFLVASGRDDLDPSAVLFEPEGVPGHPAAGFAPWQDAAAGTAPGAGAAIDYAGLNRAYGKVTSPSAAATPAGRST